MLQCVLHCPTTRNSQHFETRLSKGLKRGSISLAHSPYPAMKLRYVYAVYIAHEFRYYSEKYYLPSEKTTKFHKNDECVLD